MMGNFSFGDYFKKEAILYAWQFLTQELQLPSEKLYVSVFEKDQEAYDLWHKLIGLPSSRIIRLGTADNFWQMGDTGPCGPCSEIYVDNGVDKGCKSETCIPGCSCDRFLEIWNLVFMQYDRQPDGSDKHLAQTGVDTGMGLERLCTVLQKTKSVFDTDLFMPIIKATELLTHISYATANNSLKAAFRVVADHIRSSTFAIADGCIPSNEGRGYVIRKIIRRAAMFAQKLSDSNFLPEVAYSVIQEMGALYPALKTQEKLIITILRNETEKFSHNLINGQAILKKYMEEATHQLITGAQAFKLYDTYGFPLELTCVIAHEQGFKVDKQGFEQEMEKQRTQSGKKVITESVVLDPLIKTEFTGYNELKTTTTITALLCGETSVEIISAHECCWVITAHSPFYVEGGGQVSDQGWITFNDKKIAIKALKRINNAIAVEIIAPGELKKGDKVILEVDKNARLATMKNHTATHLLQSALMQVLGKSIKQAGSLVAPDYLRFDFTYHETPSADQIKEIEKIVNNVIMENTSLKITQTTYQEAVNRGVIAFFGEKYNPEKVRVVEVPGISAELCGGTHVKATGDIGGFKITELNALSAGNKRIVALTGIRALELFQKEFEIIKALSQEYKVKPEYILETLQKQREQLKAALSEIKNLKKEALTARYTQWLEKQEIIQQLPFLYISLSGIDLQQLRECAQDLSDIRPGFYFLVSSLENSSTFIAILSPQFSSQLNLKDFYNFLCQHGLSGNLFKNILQGGSKTLPTHLPEIIKEWIERNNKRSE
jgi:alanyl-tRNA synthetase